MARPRVLIDPQQRLACRDTEDNNDVMNDILSNYSSLPPGKEKKLIEFSLLFLLLSLMLYIPCRSLVNLCLKKKKRGNGIG